MLEVCTQTYKYTYIISDPEQLYSSVEDEWNYVENRQVNVQKCVANKPKRLED
jgi:hypothetical protein